MIQQKQVQDYIRAIVDFPHEGIIFRDVTTLFADAASLGAGRQLLKLTELAVAWTVPRRAVNN